MELQEIERLVRSTVHPAGEFDVATDLTGDGYLILTLSLIPVPWSDGSPKMRGRRARITTSGVEAFFLELDSRFVLRDFDWETEGQRDIILRMTRLALAYLRGGGVEGERRGLFGRRHPVFSIDLDRQRFTFDQVKRRRGQTDPPDR